MKTTFLTFSLDLCQSSVVDPEVAKSVQQEFGLFRDLNFQG
jgi:hypothetical protein